MQCGLVINPFSQAFIAVHDKAYRNGLIPLRQLDFNVSEDTGRRYVLTDGRLASVRH